MGRVRYDFTGWMTAELEAMLPALDDSGLRHKAAAFRAEIRARARVDVASAAADFPASG